MQNTQAGTEKDRQRYAGKCKQNQIKDYSINFFKCAHQGKNRLKFCL